MDKKIQAFLTCGTNHSEDDYFHSFEEMKKFIGKPSLNDEYIIFIPDALNPDCWDSHLKRATKFFKKMGHKLVSIHNGIMTPSEFLNDPKVKAVVFAEGNVYLLLRSLREKDIFHLVRNRIKEGVIKYIGNPDIIGPTIRTTNDMPIVSLGSHGALNIVPMNIKSHLLSKREEMGRRQRASIEQFHQTNDCPVVGLKEGSFLKIKNGQYVLGGVGKAELFQKNKRSIIWTPDKLFNLST